jgi:hypothetical protein
MFKNTPFEIALFFMVLNAVLLSACASVPAVPRVPTPPSQIQTSTPPRNAPITPAGTPTVAPTIVPTPEPDPFIKNVTFEQSTVARYDKLEIRFDVNTNTGTPDLPFDPKPPPGLQAATGITVDALVSPDGGKTTIIQPAFLYQPYTLTLIAGANHLTPAGAPRWMVRFTPQQEGNWQMRLRVQDAGGTVTYPAGSSPPLSFTVQGESSNTYRRRGFLRVSRTDPRYFEFQDGTPFIGVGFNESFTTTVTADQKLQRDEDSKIDFLRVWLSSAGINGSQWTAWASHTLPSDGYVPGVHFDTAHTFNGADVSLKLDDSNPCFFGDFWRGGVPVEPNTRYEVSARVELNDLKPIVGAALPGFVVKQAGWMGSDCVQANGIQITPPVLGTTGWITTTGVITTRADQYWLDNLYLARQNAQGGQVYIDAVHVWREDDPARVDVLHQPMADSHKYFDSMNAALWDGFIESAETHGVYLKLVVDEKNEWIRNHITPAGVFTDTFSNNNFYAAPNTKVRWLEQAWWRYIIARWGYSTAIHSFEYVNEGDPYNGYHYEAANAFGRYVHENDPSHHMVTTSFWTSFPNKEFWSNAQYPDVDYADLHAYVSTGWGATAAFIDSARIVTHPSPLFPGNGVHIGASEKFSVPITPRGLVIRGPGEWIVRYWMKASKLTVACPFNTSGGMQRIRYRVDGGGFSGGKEGVVPGRPDAKDFVCTSPGGSFDWKQFRSDRDGDGNLLPASQRLIFEDSQPHEILLYLENSAGTLGDAWIGDVELVSPTGHVVPVIGQFDTTPLDEDTSWFNRAYGDLFGASSPVGARMPLVRGETGIDYPDKQQLNPALISDTAGIWLHNNVWGQMNAGGMYDLMWWASETIPQRIYSNYLTYRNFMEGIPLNNGSYKDVGAQTSSPSMRAWGQRDDLNGRMHLWIQNVQHTWKRVVSKEPIAPISGSVVIPDVANGLYCVTWWNPYKVTNPVFLTQTLTATDALTLTLPAPLQDDVAVQVNRLEGKDICSSPN